MQIFAKRVLAFTQQPNGGNPAGVVLDSPRLSEEQMKDVSKQLQVSETAFVFPSDKADYTVRFFSPTTEVDLCGHATIATFYTIGTMLSPTKKEILLFRQETKAGILPVTLYFRHGMIDRVMMTQQKPVFEPVHIDQTLLADTLGIHKKDIRMEFSSHRVSTGLFTLPVCVSSYAILKSIIPDFQGIKQFCEGINVGSFHVFTFDTLDSSSLYHARNFAPMYGVLEDPVTGTANGAVTSFLFHQGVFKEKQMVCEQGDIMGRSGRMYVDLSKSNVQVGGRAVIVETVELDV